MRFLTAILNVGSNILVCAIIVRMITNFCSLKYTYVTRSGKMSRKSHSDKRY